MATIVGTNQGENIAAGSENDTIFARGGGDVVFAAAGNDLVFGQSGHDALNGVSGNDTLFGGTGNDLMTGVGGNDRLAVEVDLSNFGTDVLDGQDGFDSIVFETAFIIEVNGSPSQTNIAPASHGVVVNLVNLFAPGTVRDFGQTQIGADGEVVTDISATLRGQILDSTSLGSGAFGPNGVLDVVDDPSAEFADIEQFVLTGFADYFLGSAADHIILGRGGDDFISGGGGPDIIDGGTGRDTALYRFSSAGVSISLLDFGSGGSGSGGEAEGDSLFSIENVSGSDFNDTVIGGVDANLVRGFAGNDDAFGLGGVDTLFGGDGGDRLFGGLDADSLLGDRDGDTLDGGSGNDQLDGGAGSDTAVFQSWNSVDSFAFLHGSISLADGGTPGSAVLLQTIFGFPSRTTEIERDGLRSIENVVASNFDEIITGNSASNRLDGRGGLDLIDGRLGADTLLGGNGDDRLIGGPGGISQLAPGILLPDSDLLDGGGGIDTADYSGNAGSVLVTLGLDGADGRTIEFAPVFGPSVDIIRSIENVLGSDHGDLIVGNGGGNSLSGRAGNDVLEGGNGDDRLNGGTETDTAVFSGIKAAVNVNLSKGIATGQGTDTLSSIEIVVGSVLDDTITGGSGDETLIGGAGGDQLNGDAGSDTASYANATARVDARLANPDLNIGDAAGDTYTGIENLTGSRFNDRLIGNFADNLLNGGRGADTLQGAGGSDSYAFALGEGIDTVFDTGGGADRLVVGSFDDIVSSERVADNLVLSFSDGGGVTVVNHFLAANQVENVVDANGQVVVLAAGTIGGDGSGIISGTGGADYLAGRGGDDLLFGAAGDDLLFGGRGRDRLDGGTGDDVLTGGRGRDRLDGGVGDDVLLGRGGKDTFVLAAGDGQDTLYDFASGVDVIALDRDSFGFAAGASRRDAVKIGGEAPTAGAKVYVTAGLLLFDDDWSDAAGREILAAVQPDSVVMSDFILV